MLRAFVAAAFLAASVFGPAPAAAESRDLLFDVLRDGTPIGTHSVRTRTAGPRTEVEIEIDLAVRLGFLTVYRYQHRARESWENGRLAALDARTDDNGARTRVSARATDDGLAIEGPAGAYVAPADTTPTSYWRRDDVRRTRLVDTQTGRLVEVRTRPAGSRETRIDGGRGRVDLYRLEGDLDAEVGYADDGSWTALAFETRGSRIAYVRRSIDTEIRRAGD
jgi:hypothetical protein